MFGRLGFWELMLILIIALVIFGPQKLPEMGKAVGKALKEFKNATKELSDEVLKDDNEKKEETGKKASA